MSARKRLVEIDYRAICGEEMNQLTPLICPYCQRVSNDLKNHIDNLECPILKQWDAEVAADKAIIDAKPEEKP